MGGKYAVNSHIQGGVHPELGSTATFLVTTKMTRPHRVALAFFWDWEEVYRVESNLTVEEETPLAIKLEESAFKPYVGRLLATRPFIQVDGVWHGGPDDDASWGHDVIVSPWKK